MATPPATEQAGNARARALADRPPRANDAPIAAVERFSPAAWRAPCAGEGWSVAVTAHHVAATYQVVTELVRAIVTAGPPPAVLSDRGAMQRSTAQHAAAHARGTRAGTRAVSTRLTSIYTKPGLSSRLAAARSALEHHLAGARPPIASQRRGRTARRSPARADHRGYVGLRTSPLRAPPGGSPRTYARPTVCGRVARPRVGPVARRRAGGMQGAAR